MSCKIYLRATKDFKLVFGNDPSNEVIELFADSDFRGGRTDQKSTVGFLMKLNGDTKFDEILENTRS